LPALGGLQIELVAPPPTRSPSATGAPGKRFDPARPHLRLRPCFGVLVSHSGLRPLVTLCRSSRPAKVSTSPIFITLHPSSHYVATSLTWRHGRLLSSPLTSSSAGSLFSALRASNRIETLFLRRRCSFHFGAYALSFFLQNSRPRARVLSLSLLASPAPLCCVLLHRPAIVLSGYLQQGSLIDAQFSSFSSFHAILFSFSYFVLKT